MCSMDEWGNFGGSDWFTWGKALVQRTVNRPREMVPTNLESVIRGARILIVIFQDDGLVLRLWCECRREDVVVDDEFVESTAKRDEVA